MCWIRKHLSATKQRLVYFVFFRIASLFLRFLGYVLGRETHKTLIVFPAALTAKAGVNSYNSISLPTKTSRGTTTANAGVPKTDQVLKWYTPFYNTRLGTEYSRTYAPTFERKGMGGRDFLNCRRYCARQLLLSFRCFTRSVALTRYSTLLQALAWTPARNGPPQL